MEVINARSSLLSNYEVLDLLRELESDHLAREKTAIRIKKEEESSGVSSIAKHPATVDISENVRTIQVEAIKHLSAEYQPTPTQSADGIAKLVKDLASYDLTKAEKLQIVNLAPVQPVELYVIVEELEDRLGDSMGDILERVSASLSAAPSASSATEGVQGWSNAVDLSVDLEYPDADADVDMDVVNGTVFDDTGEGQGVEGDLDVEEE